MIPFPRMTRQFLASLMMASACALCAAPSVAVLDFTARGVTTDFANAVADRLSHALRDSGTFRVLDRNRVSSWRDLSRGGGYLARCDQWDCAIRAGRVMQVDRIVIGSVEAEGERIVLSARMMDIWAGVPMAKVVFRSDSGAPYLLGRGTSTFAAQFAREQRQIDSARRGTGSITSIGRINRLKVQALEEKRQSWAIVAGVSGVGGVALVGTGFVLAIRETVGCAIGNAMGAAYDDDMDDTENENEPEEPSCPENTSVPITLMRTGVVLGAVAVVSGVMAAKYGMDLQSLNKASTVNLSWAPLLDPTSGTVGLATRLEF